MSDGFGQNATLIQGRPVSSSAPNASDALVWNAATARWEPTAGGGGGGAPVTSTYVTTADETGTLANSVRVSLVILAPAVLASRPAAGVAGRLYPATDTQFLYRDTGAAWVAVGVVPDGSGKLLGSQLPIGSAGGVEAWDTDLDALAAVAATGLLSRTGAGTASARTLTGTANRVTITNGDGVAGNPTADVGTNVLVTGDVLVDRQVFTGSGTWTKPANALLVIARIIGAGAGGGSGRKGAGGTARFGGGGGGAGGYADVIVRASDCGATETVTVGAGGAGGAAQATNSTDGNVGVLGGTTSFGAHIAATGGGGALGVGGGGGTAAAGTAGFGAINTQRFGAIQLGTVLVVVGGGGGATGAGGTGGGGQVGNTSAGGGGGGGVSSLNADANGGVGGTSGDGVTGGTAGAASGGGGGNATAPTKDDQLGPGGGGGAGSSTGNGGAGGNGARGGGGGGGGAAKDAVGNSGAGGNGGDGFCVVYTLCSK